MWGLFRRAEPEMEIDVETGLAVVRWEGGAFGGRAMASFAAPLLSHEDLELVARGEIPAPTFEEDPGSRLWLTVKRIRRDEAMYARAVVLLEVAFELHGREGAFCLERVVELLHGPRDQRRSHRERQTPLVGELVRFFSAAHFVIDGSQKRSLRAAKRDTSQYTAMVTGPLLRLERHGRRFSTVRLNEGLHRLMSGEKTTAYSEVSSEIFRLQVKGHTNRHGNRPSLARRFRARMACVAYARARENTSRGGALDRVKAEDLLGRWGLVPTGTVAATGRMAAYVDCLEEDLAMVAACGGPVLSGPIERHRQAGLSWVSLRLSETARQSVSARRVKYGRHGRDNTRPPVEATRSGRAGSHGPP